MAASDLKTLRGGPVALVLQHGVCPAEAVCGEDCPSGCREVSLAMTLPLAPAEAVEIALALPELHKPERPARRGIPVSNTQFARWLKAHPEYQKTHAARVSRVNPAKYLKNWTDNQPPVGKEDGHADHVTPEVARAYCRSKGGRLPKVDAEPQSWDHLDGPFEFRVNDQGQTRYVDSRGVENHLAQSNKTADYVRIVCVY
jgi:hypothetical protein